MWGGQLAGEALNWMIKRAIKQDRPIREWSVNSIHLFELTTFRGSESIGNGYGFPSSHSQFMAYFSSFLICHLYFRHRFSSTGSPTLNYIWRITVYISLLAWTGIVAFSRFEFSSPSLFLLFNINGSPGTISDTIMQTRSCGASELALHLESPCTCVPNLFPEYVQSRLLEG